jgi:pimeloyl-ACP methyl ester carboxylesterase
MPLTRDAAEGSEPVDYRDFEEYRIAVPGGELAALRWAAAKPGAPTAVLVHGITGNALAWAAVAEAVNGRAELLACDMRGRAGSRHVDPPWGVDADVDDVLAVLDDADLGSAVLVGHSLGAFVACAVAARYPERVEAVVAVDGGVRYALPAGVNPDALIDLTIGPAVQKLSMTFADGPAYLDFHRAHPSFVGNWSPQLTAYLSRDTLWRPDGTVASSCVEEAIRADGRQLILDEAVNRAIHATTCPVTLLYAERGILNQPEGFYSAASLAAAGLDPGRVGAALVPDTNHYTIVGPGAGADAVAAALLRHAGQVVSGNAA